MGDVHATIEFAPAARAGRGRGALALACLALFAATVLLLFPGRLGPDEADMLRQAEAGLFNDWHAPILSALWSIGIRFEPKSGFVHLVEIALYFLGAFAAAASLWARGGRLAALAVIAFSILPLTWIALTAAGSKDVFLAAVMMCAAAALARFGKSRGAGSAITLLLAAAIAVNLRQNAIFAVVPLLAAAAWTLTQDRLAPLLCFAASTLAACLLSLALLAGGVLAGRTMGVQPSNLAAALFIFDIAGISAQSGEDASGGLLGARFFDTLDDCYEPVYWDPYAAWGRCAGTWHALFGQEVSEHPPEPDEWAGIFGRAMAGKPADAAIKQRLFRQWLAAIATHPLAYLRHRLAHFRADIGLGGELGGMSWVDVSSFDSPVVSALDDAANRLAAFPLLMPWAWLALGSLAFLALILAPATPARRMALALLGSGLAYGLGYFLVGVAWSFRYFQWTLFAVVIGLAWASLIPAGARNRRAG
jgi:hypothetical protein